MGQLHPPRMDKSAIIHYSKSFTTPYKDKMIIRIQEELPKIYFFFKKDIDSLQNIIIKPKTILAKLLKNYRGARWMLFSVSVKKARKG